MPKLQENLHIFIPTRGRINRQITLESLKCDEFPYPITMVVPKCEAHHWKDSLVVPDEYRFSDIRHFILQQPGSYHVVIDDDLYIASRRVDDSTKFCNLRTLEPTSRDYALRYLFEDIRCLLVSGFVHGGVAARQGANYSTSRYELVTREMRFHFYNAEVIRSLGYNFRRMETKQDLDFTLWMLERGIPNILINHFVQEQSGNNVSGGCSRYRTQEVLRRGAEALQKLHPDFVKVVNKTPKSSWKGEQRLDVNVQWKKAYCWGLKHTDLPYGKYMSGMFEYGQ